MGSPAGGSGRLDKTLPVTGWHHCLGVGQPSESTGWAEGGYSACRAGYPATRSLTGILSWPALNLTTVFQHQRYGVSGLGSQELVPCLRHEDGGRGFPDRVLPRASDFTLRGGGRVNPMHARRGTGPGPGHQV